MRPLVHGFRLWRLLSVSSMALLILLVGLPIARAQWSALAGDGIHDPQSPAIGVLQEPGEALAGLPPDTTGNRVRWVKALEQGLIDPRINLDEGGELPLRTTDVILQRTGEMPMVRFPHKVHTAWLDCTSCHDALFEREAGKTKITMGMILRGEKCGVCHGAVSFPLTECSRCHSVPRVLGRFPRQP